jgi:hypothetical protein
MMCSHLGMTQKCCLYIRSHPILGIDHRNTISSWVGKCFSSSLIKPIICPYTLDYGGHCKCLVFLLFLLLHRSCDAYQPFVCDWCNISDAFNFNCLKVPNDWDDEHMIFMLDILLTIWHANELNVVGWGDNVVI